MVLKRSSLWLLLLSAGIAALAPAVSARAQVAIEKQTDLGLWRVSVEPDKTTFIGAFGEYAAPVLLRDWDSFRTRVLGEGPRLSVPRSSPPASSAAVGGGGGSSRPSLLNLLLPGGRLPKDFRWNYVDSVGWRVSASYEPNWLPWWNDRAPQLVVAYFRDANAVSAFAPTGLGVLTDPTHGYARAEIAAFQEEIRLPVYVLRNNGGETSLWVGQGWMWQRAFSNASVTSAFLDLTGQQQTFLLAPTFSLSGEFRPGRGLASALDIPAVASFAGVNVSLSAFKTEYVDAGRLRRVDLAVVSGVAA